MSDRNRANPSPTPRQNRRLLSFLLGWSRSTDARQRKVHRGKSILRELPQPLHVVLRRTPRIYELVAELHNLWFRMALRRIRRYPVYGIDLGPCYLENARGQLVECIRTHACIQDIENFVASHPWATAVDVEHYRDAWLAGAAWGESNSGIVERQPLAFEPPQPKP